MYLILSGYRVRLCSWGWMKSEVDKGKVDRRDEWLADILDYLAA